MSAQQPGLRITGLAGVALDGVTEARWGQAEVLVKTVAAHPNVVVNEYIANRLAIALGIPVPLGDIATDDAGVPVWAVAAIRDRGFDMPPPSAAILQQVPESMRAKMVCFDALIQNDDRSDENILVGSAGHAWLIDHDQSLFCDRTDRTAFLSARRDQPWNDFGRLWRLAPPTPQAVIDAAAHLRGMSVDVIHEATSQLRRRSLINAAEQESLVDFVTHRRDNIHRLVDPSAIQSVEVRHHPANQDPLWDEGGEHS